MKPPQPQATRSLVTKLLPYALLVLIAAVPDSAFAQADFDQALQRGGNIIMKIAFLVGAITVMAGGWSLRRGESDAAKMSILGGMVIALSFPIMSALFDAAGMSGGKINF